MAHATPSGSARIAIGMKSLHKSIHTTRQQQRKRALNDTIDGPVSREQISNKDTGNESEVLRDLLHSYGCRVMILRAVKNSVDDTFSTLRVQHSTDKTNDDKSCDELVPLTDKVIDNQDTGAVDEWVKTVQTQKKNEVLLCLLWLSQEQYKLARTFCLTVCIDATYKANLSLLTITTKDAFAKMCVLLRLWIPNQKTWMFSYILMHVIPTLIGANYCNRVRAIVSDSDAHLIRMINLSIDQRYINAVRLPCTWHIVD